MKPGIDVSHWQKEIDWKQVKQAGVRFAFFKATEFPPGKTERFVDPQVYNNAAGTAAHRINSAPYHFFRTHIPATVQAFGFLDIVKDLPFTLRPVLDLELAGLRGRALCNEVLLWLETVEDLVFALWKQIILNDPTDADDLQARMAEKLARINP